jgi:GMP synthase (glutamine-hydrolysing)
VSVEQAESKAGSGTVSSVDSAIVIDFGGQTAQLIVRRVREAHVYCELIPHDADASVLERLNPRGIILSGGPASVYADGAPQLPDWVFQSNLPVLGICYGMQLLAHGLDGKVAPADHKEYGPARIHRNGEHPLFRDLPQDIDVWMSHGDRIDELPAGFELLASSDNSPHAAMGNERQVGIQFHPEVVHTPLGRSMIRNFLYDICGCTGNWTPESFIEEAVASIRSEVGDGRVLLALSGGVDSSVAAALIHKAIGDQLTTTGCCAKVKPRPFRRFLAATSK